ncbi:MAG: hypothetical protein HOD87_05110 [Gammaproteobacteria bacterium]|jgi:hypothetical protein|nr:hypothetical protein [Gammaproteobacteria bacterium]
MKITADQINFKNYKKAKDPYRWFLLATWTPLFLIFGGAVIAAIAGVEPAIALGIGLACFPLLFLAVIAKRYIRRKCPTGGEKMIHVHPQKRSTDKLHRQICKNHKIYITTDNWVKTENY